MEIKFDFDGNNYVLDILEGFFLAMLKEQLKTELASYGEGKVFSHDDDIADSKKRIKALKVLIEFYTTREEYDLIMRQMYDSVSS